MKILKRDKRTLLIFLVLFPTIMMLSSLVTNVRGGPYVPESHADNGWHWDVDVGDHIYFESEFILTNATTGEVFSMFRAIWIYNITSIENVTTDWLGTHQFSQVNATQNYYNVTDDELEAYGPSEEIALFGYNSTDPINHRIRAGMGGMPYLLPINGSNGLEVGVLDDIINETFYYPMSELGAYNAFDYYSSSLTTNSIYFSNSTDGFFSSGFYYDNGTLNTGSAYLRVEMGGGPALINATMTQVFDYDITDEVQWGVNVGDTFIYDWFEGSGGIDDGMEVLVNVTSISDMMFEKTNNGFSEDPIQMAYQVVSADLYLWNGTDYEQVEWDIPIGLANNFYSQYFDTSGPNPFNFLYPINVAKDDYLFMWNNDTLRIWNAPFDELYYSENGYIESLVIDSTSIAYVRTVIDKTTGIVQINTMLGGGGLMHFEIKSQTLVDWSLNVGDIIYYKDNGEIPRDIKATISGTYTVFVNMTMLISDLTSMGIFLTLPMGQPELQFFSYLEGFFEVWDPNLQAWIPESMRPLSIANIYWPISPLSFEFGPPLLMPQGTTSSELTGIFDFFGNIYDDISYNPGHIVLRNTTLNRDLNFHFDEASGKVTMMYGWSKNPGPISEWNYMSIYPKFHQALSPGSHSFTFNTDFPSGTIVDVDVDIGPASAGAALIYNYFTMNPVNVSIPHGTPLAYVDQLFANYTAISGNITMTITLPSSIDINKMLFFFYAYNMSGSLQWDAAPPEFYVDNVTFNNATNQIIIEMEPFMFAKGIMSAMAYITREDALAEIPGYDLFLMSLMIIIVSSLIIKKVRKKK
ncbi:MAG: Loki-CTERM sorting domain-containing protein [Promethearchaeota archaeon]|jgi:hypothetical protein